MGRGPHTTRPRPPDGALPPHRAKDGVSGDRSKGAGASELRCDAQQLMICLPRHVFGAMWDTLVARLTEVWQSRAFIAWTQPTMTVRGNGPDAPRWKVHPLDVLSELLFLLKVLTSHELMRLWAVIDWSAINAMCAPLYHNAHGRPHAWALAQMIALLVLMFLYGVPHETTLLRRVQASPAVPSCTEAASSARAGQTEGSGH